MAAVNEKRIGYLQISRTELKRAQQSTYGRDFNSQLFSMFWPNLAICFGDDMIMWQGHSEHFKEVEPDEEAPTYLIEITENAHSKEVCTVRIIPRD